MEEEALILKCWHTNAKSWTNAIANQSIESRVAITNNAILDCIECLTPKQIWDVGCGEGWLCRKLTDKGFACFGTDAIAGLIDSARCLDARTVYEVCSYQDIIKGAKPAVTPDLMVFNFSLFGKELTVQLMDVLFGLLPMGGKLVIQTLHPHSIATLPYQSGWRKGSWDGFSNDFTDPAPWYFRTMEDWVSLFLGAGFRIEQFREPIHPKTDKPASLIIVACK